ncbi:hypothetical protein SAMN05421774_10930 [Gemmobacter megaterium]|uniref:Glutamine amidotransferase domain-containing protein n=1 Tax=Gemmobacter megaterium TaxID=1086013 RepID=A0A1N7QCT9_9RHOB|nr:hypothetical protein [Gemmobacter megaterium]GGE25364.1 membrane protein [Gemmobacter megaterium]SIT20675.1 hypothetical protein SAMN05421774_10930 [Gemmobacter megaterium]
MTGAVVLDPLLGWPMIWGLAGFAALLLALAIWQRMSGGLLRALALAAILVALLNPSWQQEDRAPLSDIVLVVVDDSASQRIADRPAQTETALEGMLARIARMPATEAQVIRVPDDDADGGTLAMARLAEAMADIPRARLAGVFVISDGHVHDAALAPELPAPLHLLLTGEPQDWDRRLLVKTAPAFAIMGEPVSLILRIEDQGAVPAALAGYAELTVSIGAEPAQTFTVPVGEDLELPVNLPHGGINVLQLSVAAQEGELTAANNAAVLRINGVRDRLRVLLVSGEPHAGERVWRNLLKSDASVDLVHFTILRPPEKQDGVPVTELSLIAFPTKELFVDKVDEFDLIIFDRYRRRGILPMSYLENVRDYVRNGGAVLIAAGPEFGSADSLWRSPLAEILPISPTSRVLEEGFRPTLTDTGRKHPVTEGLQSQAPQEGWGRWFRQIDMTATRGQVVMEGIGNRPLLVLDREGEGRVAMLGSDHIWLWGRGYEGGGPQLELLRRLAHWTMKEPELEEETLGADAQGLRLTVSRRTLGDAPGQVTITAPDGAESRLDLSETRPGLWQGTWDAPGMGLYRLTEGEMTAVAALGPAAPREFEQTIAASVPMQPVLDATGGGVVRLSDGLPDIRRVAEGRVAAGRGWLGITPREAFVTQDIRISPFLPPWALLLLVAGLALAAWLWEGRQPARKA